jgi:hypothetical protein
MGIANFGPSHVGFNWPGSARIGDIVGTAYDMWCCLHDREWTDFPLHMICMIVLARIHNHIEASAGGGLRQE